MSTSPSASPDQSARPPAPVPAPPTRRRGRRRLLIGSVSLVGVVLGAAFIIPAAEQALHTVSTDDAYVNGHVTLVAPRVPGQVRKVPVDDNVRVKAGDVLVELDPEPYQVQVNIAKAAVAAAEADLVTARAAARGVEGQMRSLRFSLERAIEDVDNQIALLRSRVATLDSRKATLARSRADYDRNEPLYRTKAISPQEFDVYKQTLQVAEAQVEEALQGVYQVRVALGLPPKPLTGNDLTEVPPDLNQTFSTVRQAQASLLQAAAQIGLVGSFNTTPKQLVADFHKRDPGGDIDRIYEALLKTAPGIIQAETKLAQAKRNLDQAELNLRYCTVVAEIDGVVTRRNVNPGNNVQAGQQVMAVRSLTEIWIDANFKETQLADLRIGQRVDVYADTYGSRRAFRGRITGFTYGTGSTLALLPPQNATGNFVKVVQRLPVRIELENYDPDDDTLFAGLSITPYVYVKESPAGPNAGRRLQELARSGAPAGGAK